MSQYEHILVAVDESPISYAAVEHALELARAFKSKVTLLSVIAIDPFIAVDFYKVAPAITEHFIKAEEQALLRLNDLKSSFERDGIDVSVKVVHGVSPSEGILKTVETDSVSLVMMGSHGRTGLQKMVLGSVAQNVLNASVVPVFIVKQ
ncbi:universal stress protein [Acinetobacter sp. NCu2D-2]|uniref:universal stress protein n=1 Tax=Acinetobacter sp. NCu2D-2 TaxID=1608473 RepID=UPI0007CE03EB|nr:universal stress protein [Acinetobacter sp. NCu2D-2]ANF81953.1 universal stress protein [Acinetobacter sp. NCu2D-2]